MTKKDFELIAEAIHAVRKEYTGDDTWVVDEVTHSVATKLHETHLRFDRDRFLKASGVGS